MRAKTLGAICLAGNLVVLFMASCGAKISPESSIKGVTYGLVRQGEPCVHDADCRSGLCNRGRCGMVTGRYGNQCDPPTRDAPPIEKLPEHLCGPLLCVEGRCRSCRSDEECQSTFGMGKCKPVPSADQPGYAECRSYTTRRARGACQKDADCQSLFCDRGSCAAIQDLSRGKYGDSCSSSGPEPLPPQLQLSLTEPGGPCQGYLCIDKLCRSCASDVECHEGGEDPHVKCVDFLDWPGKVCVTEQEYMRYFPPYVPNVAPSIRYDEDDEDWLPPPPAPPGPPEPLPTWPLPPRLPPPCPPSLPPPPEMFAPFFSSGGLMIRPDGRGGTCVAHEAASSGDGGTKISGPCSPFVPPAPPPPEEWQRYLKPGLTLARPDGHGKMCSYTYVLPADAGAGEHLR